MEMGENLKKMLGVSEDTPAPSTFANTPAGVQDTERSSWQSPALLRMTGAVAEKVGDVAQDLALKAGATVETSSAIATGASMVGDPSNLLGVGGKGIAAVGAIATKDFLKLFPSFEKSVLKDGDELVKAYHGTQVHKRIPDEPIKEFRTPTGAVMQSTGMTSHIYPGDLGTWFGSSPKVANVFAGANDNKTVLNYGARHGEVTEGGAVYEVYLNLQNPKVFENHSAFKKFVEEFEDKGKSANYVRRSLIKEGHDGILIKSSFTDAGGSRSDIVTFHPHQVQPTTGAGYK